MNLIGNGFREVGNHRPCLPRHEDLGRHARLDLNVPEALDLGWRQLDAHGIERGFAFLTALLVR